jgi:hypothetical protein
MIDMKTLTVFITAGLIALSLIATASVTAQTALPELKIGRDRLTLDLQHPCPRPRPSAETLSKYLVQYDPAGEAGLSPEENPKPYTKRELRFIKEGIVEEGFIRIDGDKHAITWMDFDGDGICDFTGSSGTVGGKASIARYFLFRGLANGRYKLVHSYLEWVPSDLIAVPYIPIRVSGERLPILVNTDRDGSFMQWDPAKKKFVSCDTLLETVSKGKANKPSKSTPVKPQSDLALARLCEHIFEIEEWATNQLPNGNIAPRYFE